MSNFTRPQSPSNKESSKAIGKASSFVLKLHTMVHGAPDDVVSWVPSGEAFRISDLSRLESETLPQYFRHNRFQSLVRQLNFYNFRKINRERTFWVYYHPLFHRDRPELMPKLRRRTCPGYDGRKNRPSEGISPYDDMMGEYGDGEEYADSYVAMVSPPVMGYEVSRSPSPSFSPIDQSHASAMRGDIVRSSIARDSSVKSVVSVEKKSPTDATMATRRRTSLSSKDSFGINVDDSIAGSSSSQLRSGPFQAKELDSEQYNHHVLTSNISKKSKKATETATAAASAAVSSDNEDDTSTYSISLTRKRYSKELNQERHDHNIAVSEVSRHLNGICSDYNASTISERPRGRGGRGFSGHSQTRYAGQAPAFGLDKPHDHYYRAGKCDLFTYDCEDGFVIDEDCRGRIEEENIGEDVLQDIESPSDLPEPIVIPPSQCPIVIESLSRACLEGKLVDCNSTFDRALASAILWFCLSTHPNDPDLCKKISRHLKKKPLLAKEFEMYCQALFPGMSIRGKVSASENLKRDWKMFSSNFMNRVVLAHHKHMRLTESENEAIVALECWVRDD